MYRDQIKLKGIILKEIKLRESDKILVCLTDTLGKISISARGVRRPKSQNIGASQFLCFSEFIVYPSSNMYNLSQSDVIESFYKIRTDIEKLTYSAHFAQILMDVTNENEDTRVLLRIFLNILYYLMNNRNDNVYLADVFELRLLKELGYMPRLDKDYENWKEIYFSLKESILKDSKPLDDKYIRIDKSTLDILKKIFNEPFKKVLEYKCEEKEIGKIKNFSKRYLSYCLDKKYNKLDFLNLIK